MRALARRLIPLVLACELLGFEALVARFLCVLELLSRIAMLAAGPPAASARLSVTVAAGLSITAITAARLSEPLVAMIPGFLGR